jgi:hypothetical protein
LSLLEKNCTDIKARQTQLKTMIPDKADDLLTLGIKLSGMEGNPHLAKQHGVLSKKMAALAEEVRGLRREYVENTAMLESLTERLENKWKGVADDPHAHIRHLAMPVRSTRMRFDRVAETWAAVSLSLLLFGIVALVFFAPHYLAAGLAVITLMFIVTESVLRGAFVETVAELTVFLSIIGSVILLIHFWFWFLMGALLAIAVFLMVQRLRELTG